MYQELHIFGTAFPPFPPSLFGVTSFSLDPAFELGGVHAAYRSDTESLEREMHGRLWRLDGGQNHGRNVVRALAWWEKASRRVSNHIVISDISDVVGILS